MKIQNEMKKHLVFFVLFDSYLHLATLVRAPHTPPSFAASTSAIHFSFFANALRYDGFDGQCLSRIDRRLRASSRPSASSSLFLDSASILRSSSEGPMDGPANEGIAENFVQIRNIRFGGAGFSVCEIRLKIPAPAKVGNR
jgi:hypothetical protein